METKRLKIGFYSPYYDSLSGGERYVLTLAAHWSKVHEVVLFWDDPNIIGLSESRFGLDLRHIRVVPNIFRNSNIFSKLRESRRYDLIFFLSDGSIPMSLARHNILHFQVPFKSVLVDPWKSGRYDYIVCNSRFTKESLDLQLGTRAVVIYPPVQLAQANNHSKRKKRILSVGRFSGFLQAKKQDVLIEAFKEGLQSGLLKDWEMVLAGGLLDSDEKYFAQLNKLISGFAISLLPNITNDELIKLYDSSRIYWHAAGYGETDPTRMEHFGITTAEAMSAGAVPVVYAAGGQMEIVRDGINGFLWNSKDELLEKTRRLINDDKKYSAIQLHAIERAKDFGSSHFTRAFDALIAGW